MSYKYIFTIPICFVALVGLTNTIRMVVIQDPAAALPLFYWTGGLLTSIPVYIFRKHLSSTKRTV